MKCFLPSRHRRLPIAFEGEPEFAGVFARAAVKDKMSFLTAEEELLVSKKVNELSGNVYENKGPLWKIGAQGGNVVENTCG
jgi:hypothetical protein